MNIIPKKLLAGLFCSVCITTFSQTPPCRQWYYKTDSRGNQIKDICKEAWQENGDGQKHGKYISYYENGVKELVASYTNGVLNGKFITYNQFGGPDISTTYLNGKLNGDYKRFGGDGVTVWEEGKYINDEKNGFWKMDGGSGIIKNGIKVGIWDYPQINITMDYDKKTTTYKWNNLTFESSYKTSALNGEIMAAFSFRKSDFKKAERKGCEDCPSFSYNYWVSITINSDKPYDIQAKFGFDASRVEGFGEFTSKEQHYPFTLPAIEIYRIVKCLAQDGVPDNPRVILKFIDGKINSSEIKIYNEKGQLYGSINLPEEMKKITEGDRRKTEEIKLQKEKENELKQKDNAKFNAVITGGTIDEYLSEYPNGIHATQLKQLQTDYLRNLEQVEVGFNQENPNMFLGFYNSGFNYYDLRILPKSKLIRDITFEYLLNRFNGKVNIAGLIETYNIAESENCSKELLDKFPKWVKPVSSALSLTSSGKFAESNNTLNSISSEPTLKEFAIVDFCMGVNHLLLKDKGSSKQALKKVYATADAGNGKYYTSVYDKEKTLIDLLISSGMDESTLMSALGNTSHPRGSKFYVDEKGKIVWYN